MVVDWDLVDEMVDEMVVDWDLVDEMVVVWDLVVVVWDDGGCRWSRSWTNSFKIENAWYSSFSTPFPISYFIFINMSIII